MDDTTRHEIIQAARHLLRAARSGTLATVRDGQPSASLVTPATAPDGSVLLLLSELSEHTRHLRRDGRCALLLTGPANGPNPQTTPRLTLRGQAEPTEDAALRQRWLAVHPYAALYVGFGDFHLWRLTLTDGSYVGGFAQAHRLAGSDLVADDRARAAVAEAESEVIQHCNADHPDALELIANAAGAAGAGWLMAACDVDGFDLVRAEETCRVAWPAPVDGPGSIRKALIHLAGAARKAATTSAGPA